MISDAARPVRKRHYVDRSLQFRLIAGLVLLEALIILLTLYWLHGRMEFIAEEQLYRVHHAAPEPLLAPLLEQVAIGLAVMLACNATFLLVVEALWTRRVNALLGTLRPLFDRTADLDLRTEAQDHAPAHPALELARSWRGREAVRLAELRATIQALDPQWRGTDPVWREGQRRLVSQLRRCVAPGWRPDRAE